MCLYLYDDDTFVLWIRGPEYLGNFLNHLNSLHPTIHVTMEIESDGHLLFLDIIYTEDWMVPWVTLCTGS